MAQDFFDVGGSELRQAIPAHAVFFSGFAFFFVRARTAFIVATRGPDLAALTAGPRPGTPRPTPRA